MYMIGICMSMRKFYSRIIAWTWMDDKMRKAYSNNLIKFHSPRPFGIMLIMPFSLCEKKDKESTVIFSVGLLVKFLWLVMAT